MASSLRQLCEQTETVNSHKSWGVSFESPAEHIGLRDVYEDSIFLRTADICFVCWCM